MIRRVATLLALLLLALPGVVVAADCEIDMSSNASIVKSAKSCGFMIANAGIGNKVPAPRKLAIAAFQIRFDYTGQQYGFVLDNAFTGVRTTSTDRNRVQFEDAVYQEITDSMYDMFVATLENLGYEVVPKDDVASSKVYAMVEASEEPKKKQSMVRMSASGLKNIRGKGGATASIAAEQKLSGLNEELGADATIAVFATMGLVTAAKKKEGVKVCLGTHEASFDAGQEFVMLVLGGTKVGKFPGGKPMYSPKARATISFAKKKRLCAAEAVQNRTGKRWAWTPKYETDLDTYIENTVSLFGWASEIAMLQLTAAANR